MNNFQILTVINFVATVGFIFWLYRKNLIAKYTDMRNTENIHQEIRNLYQHIETREETMRNQYDRMIEEENRNIDYRMDNISYRIDELQREYERTKDEANSEMNSRIPL